MPRKSQQQHPPRKRLFLGVGLLFVASLFALPPVAQAIDVFITAVVSTNVVVSIDSVRPQGRVGVDQTNSDTTYYLTVRTPQNDDNTILFTQPTLDTTNNAGVSTVETELTTISPGTYDIGLKGHQHLTRVLQDVTLVEGGNVLNFTTTDNSPGRGSIVLDAGDINGAGTDPATLGDDVVNSVDLSTMIANIDDVDPTGNAERSNLNQDTAVNSVDISWLIYNLDKTGDR